MSIWISLLSVHRQNSFIRMAHCSNRYILLHIMSDFLRFLILYKYGGIYLDLDVVVQKSLDTLPANFCGIEGGNDLNVAVLGLQNKTGHDLSELCLKLVAFSFDNCNLLSFFVYFYATENRLTTSTHLAGVIMDHDC